jgi:O-antigen biosynthesis protein
MTVHDLITVAVFGHPDLVVNFESDAIGDPTVATTFNIYRSVDDRDLGRVLAEVRPQVIFTFGTSRRFERLFAAPLDVRRRWVHFDTPPAAAVLAARALAVFVDVATNDRLLGEPLVSVFTPTYQTGDRLRRPYESLIAQLYTNWEWVVYDDSPDDETYTALREIARNDQRVRIFRGDGNWGAIGEVKRRLCGLARGSILVELDHDDELTPLCVGSLVEAFARFPDAGFAYTDCAEVFEDGEPAGYPEGWGYGFGSYRWERFRENDYLVTNFPSVNAKTIRNIAGTPNHARAWRRSAYEAIGGHSSEVHVADDYELMLRTFLQTRIVHVKRFGYIQYLGRGGENTQRVRNKEIQRLVGLFQARYENEIHDRFVELGIDDFIWVAPGLLDFGRANPTQAPMANYEMS